MTPIDRPFAAAVAILLSGIGLLLAAGRRRGEKNEKK